MPTDKITLSNLNQFIALAKKQPALMNIGGMVTFRAYMTVTNSSGCAKCNKNASKLAALRPQFEAALATLTPDERNRMKSLLDASQVCYYSKQPNGVLKQICF